LIAFGDPKKLFGKQVGGDIIENKSLFVLKLWNCGTPDPGQGIRSPFVFH